MKIEKNKETGIREFGQPKTFELPRAHTEGLTISDKESITEKAGENVYRNNVLKSVGTLAEFQSLSDTKDEKDFCNQYERYVTDADELKEQNPKMYEFMRTRIFCGKEYPSQKFNPSFGISISDIELYKKHVEDAKRSMERTKNSMEDARRSMDSARNSMESAKRSWQDSNTWLNDALKSTTPNEFRIQRLRTETNHKFGLYTTAKNNYERAIQKYQTAVNYYESAFKKYQTAVNHYESAYKKHKDS